MLVCQRAVGDSGALLEKSKGPEGAHALSIPLSIKSAHARALAAGNLVMPPSSLPSFDAQVCEADFK